MTGRALASGNVTHINSRHTHPVMLGKFEFTGTSPVYVHSGLGTIVFDGNSYTGVGDYGGMEGLEETEALVPAAVQVSLSGIPSQFITEAKDSANFGDRVTLYAGYRNDDGTLIDEPWIFYRGRIKGSRVVKGKKNVAIFQIQHVLAVLNRKTNTRYTDEEQQRRYPGDDAFKHIEKMEDIKLNWGRRGGRFNPDGPRPRPPGTWEP